MVEGALRADEVTTKTGRGKGGCGGRGRSSNGGSRQSCKHTTQNGRGLQCARQVGNNKGDTQLNKLCPKGGEVGREAGARGWDGGCSTTRQVHGSFLAGALCVCAFVLTLAIAGAEGREGERGLGYRYEDWDWNWVRVWALGLGLKV